VRFRGATKRTQVSGGCGKAGKVRLSGRVEGKKSPPECLLPFLVGTKNLSVAANQRRGGGGLGLIWSWTKKVTLKKNPERSTNPRASGGGPPFAGRTVQGETHELKTEMSGGGSVQIPTAEKSRSLKRSVPAKLLSQGKKKKKKKFGKLSKEL